MHDSLKYVKSRKDVPFCGYGLFFYRKHLTIGMLKSKLPLIIIVAP